MKYIIGGDLWGRSSEKIELPSRVRVMILHEQVFKERTVRGVWDTDSLQPETFGPNSILLAMEPEIYEPDPWLYAGGALRIDHEARIVTNHFTGRGPFKGLVWGEEHE